MVQEAAHDDATVFYLLLQTLLAEHEAKEVDELEAKLAGKEQMTHIEHMHSSDLLDNWRLEKGVIGWFTIKREDKKKNGEKRKRKRKRKKRLAFLSTSSSGVWVSPEEYATVEATPVAVCMGFRMPVYDLPSFPVKQYVSRSSWSYMRWSVLSRVRVIADPTWRSLPGGGLSLASGGFRVDLAAQLSTSSSLPLARVAITVAVMAAAPPASQDASGFRVHSPTIQAFLASGGVYWECHRGGQFCEYQGQYGSCSAFSFTQWSIPPTSGGSRVDLSAQLSISFMPFTGTSSGYG